MTKSPWSRPAVIVVVVGISLLAFGLDARDGYRREHPPSDLMERGTSDLDLAEISARTGIWFPPGAKLENARSASWIGSERLWARVSFDAAQADNVEARVTGPGVTSDTDRQGMSNALAGTDVEWWNPDSVKSFATVRVTDAPVRLRESGYLLVLISKGDPRVAVIYIHMFVS